MKDFLERLTNWKTTIVGLAGVIVTALIIFGVVGKEEGDKIVPLVDNMWAAVLAFVAALQSIILIFSKDSPKE